MTGCCSTIQVCVEVSAACCIVVGNTVLLLLVFNYYCCQLLVFPTCCCCCDSYYCNNTRRVDIFPSAVLADSVYNKKIACVWERGSVSSTAVPPWRFARRRWGSDETCHHVDGTEKKVASSFMFCAERGVWQHMVQTYDRNKASQQCRIFILTSHIYTHSSYKYKNCEAYNRTTLLGTAVTLQTAWRRSFAQNRSRINPLLLSYYTCGCFLWLGIYLVQFGWFARVLVHLIRLSVFL